MLTDICNDWELNNFACETICNLQFTHNFILNLDKWADVDDSFNSNSKLIQGLWYWKNIKGSGFVWCVRKKAKKSPMAFCANVTYNYGCSNVTIRCTQFVRTIIWHNKQRATWHIQERFTNRFFANSTIHRAFACKLKHKPTNILWQLLMMIRSK